MLHINTIRDIGAKFRELKPFETLTYLNKVGPVNINIASISITAIFTSTSKFQEWVFHHLPKVNVYVILINVREIKFSGVFKDYDCLTGRGMSVTTTIRYIAGSILAIPSDFFLSGSDLKRGPSPHEDHRVVI